MANVATRSSASTAIAALGNLKQGLQNVSSTIVTAGGDPFMRLLTDGTWVYGAENVEVEEGSLWAINPFSIEHGWVSWTDHDKKGASNEVVGEVMVPMTSPLPPQTELRDTGWEWSQQLKFTLQCLNGEDIGQQVVYKTTSVGGMNAMKSVIAALMKQIDTDPDRPVPVISLDTDHYQHKKWGKTYVPVFTIVRFEELTDDAPEAEPESPDSDIVEEVAETPRDRKEAAEQAPDTARPISKAAAQAAMRELAGELKQERKAAPAAEQPAEDAPRRRRRV